MTILLPGQPPPPPKRNPIYARSGWPIPQPEVEDAILNPDEMRDKERLYHSRYPVITRSLSLHPYNCVGMIFANRRAWIDIDVIDDLLREDGYIRKARNEIMIGDLVLYRIQDKPKHIAVVTVIDKIGQTLNIQVLSKWGSYPEFIHPIDRVPEGFGSPVEFYTDRINL